MILNREKESMKYSRRDQADYRIDSGLEITVKKLLLSSDG